MERYKYIEYTDKGNKKYCFVFDKVDDDELAYFIGYLACDGGFINSKYPFMMVSSTEKHIIEHFRDLYCPDKNIFNVGKKSSEKVNAINDIFELRFPAKMNSSFNKFGIFCYKQNRRLVGIKRRYLDAYIAGCIDADGFISVTYRKDCRIPRLRWFLTHGSELFLSDIQLVLSDQEVSTTLRQHGKNVWRLQAQNTKQNIKFLSEIGIFLQNKQKQNILNNYLKKYFVPQASDELLEPEMESAAKPQDVEGSETR